MDLKSHSAFLAAPFTNPVGACRSRGARHRHLEVRARGDEPRAGSDLRVLVRRARINGRGAADAARRRHLRRAHLSSARTVGVHPPHAAASLPWSGDPRDRHERLGGGGVQAAHRRDDSVAHGAAGGTVVPAALVGQRAARPVVRLDDWAGGRCGDDARQRGGTNLRDLLPRRRASKVRTGGNERLVFLHHQCLQGAVQRRARTDSWADTGVECRAQPLDRRRHLRGPLAHGAHPAEAIRRAAARIRLRGGAAAPGHPVMCGRFSFARHVLAMAGAVMLCVSTNARAQPQELKWAGDPEGGAPFVEADPADPNQVTGFDGEIEELIAKGIQGTPRFLFVPYGSIDQAIERGTADIGLSGMEDTPARRAAMATTIPYYAFREVLAVRDADAGALRRLADLKGRRVGTLGGTIAYEILLQGERRFGLEAVSYDDDVHPYSDLLLGRVDAVLLDNVLAERRRKSMTGITVQPAAVAIIPYVGVLAARNASLRDAANEVLRRAMRDGTLERIFRKWGVWNDDQPALYASLGARGPVPGGTRSGMNEPIGLATLGRW